MKFLESFSKYNNDIRVESMDFSGFFKVIYGSGGMPKDETVFDRIRFMHYTDFDYHQKTSVKPYFVVLFNGDKVIGVAKIGYYDMTAESENEYAISYFSIDKSYRNRGYSRMMADELFKLAKEHGLDMTTSSYSFVGFKKLRHLFNEYADKWGVNFRDKKDDDSLHDAAWMYDDDLNHMSEKDI
jgi:RimJ/RimL family protein N-acetyltransferase